ncbi:hypothetical protein Deiofobo_0396 [Pseudomonas phage Deifobo]|nr:hypothetical protein Deiofobo_0396 [Pseudomonas phage Deifobo]
MTKERGIAPFFLLSQLQMQIQIILICTDQTLLYSPLRGATL